MNDINNKTSIWNDIKTFSKSGFRIWLFGVQLIIACFYLRKSSRGHNYDNTIEVIINSEGTTAKEKLAMLKAVKRRSFSLYYEVVTDIVEDSNTSASEKVEAIKSLNGWRR